MKIAVIGAGFVGQATGKGFAKHKNSIVFIDIDPEKVASLRKEGFAAFPANEYDKITTDVTMFCVPTPTQSNAIQLDYIKQAAAEFGTRLKTHKKYHVAVIRSTVPPKTTRDILLPIIEEPSGKKVGKDFGLCMQPEYLREKTANNDFARPWFILIGQYDKKSGDTLEKLYRPFDAPIERVALEEAELQKYVHNLYNAVKIAFFNEMRIIARSEQWDAEAILRATAQSCEGIWNPIYGLRNYGPFDGSCLPKDTVALLEWGDKYEHDLHILRAVVEANLRHEQALGTNNTVRVNHLAGITV